MKITQQHFKKRLTRGLIGLTWSILTLASLLDIFNLNFFPLEIFLGCLGLTILTCLFTKQWRLALITLGVCCLLFIFFYFLGDWLDFYLNKHFSIDLSP